VTQDTGTSRAARGYSSVARPRVRDLFEEGAHVKRVLVGGAVLTLAIGGMGLAQAQQPSGYKVTGGGQIINEGASGPGDTLAFQAQQIEGDDEDAARGQLQYNGRTGDDPQKFHGLVTCLQVDGDFARLAGTKKSETGETGFFRLIVHDVDNDGPQNGTEMLLFNPDADDANCDEVDDEDYENELGRGNIQIHEPKSGGQA
jgi:hypothetical protein